MTKLRISVGLATYNGERFLHEQLESLARQTLLPWEVVVCDDGSSDATVSILQDFAEDAPFPVRIHRNGKSRGHGETFLRAAGLCGGDCIAFCDQDDVWLERKLERCAEVLVEYPSVVLVSHSADQVDGQLTPIRHRVPDHKTFSVSGPLENRPLSVLPGFTCCFRRFLLEYLVIDQRPEDMHRPGVMQSHDQFIYHIANTYGNTARLPESLVLYRRHSNTVTGTPGTGVYELALAKVLKNRMRGSAEAYQHMVSQALQHQTYYRTLLARLGERSEIADRHRYHTTDAIAYYGEVADAFQARAELHARETKMVNRILTFSKLVAMGAYGALPTGRGFGKAAMAKDLAGILSW